MPDQNGTKLPIPFPAGAAIPILGQPYHLKAVIPTVLASCGCEAKEPLLLIGLGAAAKCPACQRVFRVRAFEGSSDTGQMTATLDVGHERKAGE